MKHYLLAALLGTVATAAWPAQDTAADDDPAAATEPADGTAPADAAPVEEAPPPPELTGLATGAVSATRFDVPVDCTGFGDGDLVSVRSDPGEDDSLDNNGDGVIVNLSASRSSGEISLDLKAGGISYQLTGSDADIQGRILNYAVIISYGSGDDDEISLSVDCGG